MVDFDIDKWINESLGSENAGEYLYDLYLNSPSDKADVRRGFKRFVRTTGIRKKGYSGAVLFPCIALAALSLTFALAMFFAPVPGQAQWQSVSTSAGESRELLLCDGTRLKVGPCSSIIFPDIFDGDTRKIFATGDVFFNVAKDDDKLFVVSSNGLDVKVHGTEFHLYSYPGIEQQEVALAHGSVSVSLDEDGKDIVLEPGEMLMYSRNRNICIRKPFNAESFNNQMSGSQILFDHEDLPTIARKLSNRFGVRVLVCDRVLMGQNYYASFVNGENLPEILESLSRQGEFSVRRSGEDYILTE